VGSATHAKGGAADVSEWRNDARQMQRQAARLGAAGAGGAAEAAVLVHRLGQHGKEAAAAWRCGRGLGALCGVQLLRAASEAANGAAVLSAHVLC
jgi:hypothetical protein